MPTSLPTRQYWSGARDRWDELVLLSKGESKEIRIVDQDFVMVRMIPSLYSFTKNRAAMIEGTDELRLRAFELLASVLRTSGVLVAAVHFGDDFYVTRRMKRGELDYVPPIEVIVKARHVGTPKHSLYNIDGHSARNGNNVQADRAHDPYVRFDYTNPLHDADGNRLRDECIPEGLANRYIDARAAEQTAISAFCGLFAFLSARGIRLDDICFKIDHTGRVVFGELSPDCMRSVWVGAEDDLFAPVGLDTSKDTFRAGSAEGIVLERYRRFITITSGSPIRSPVSPFEAECLFQQ